MIVDLFNNIIIIYDNYLENWKVIMVDIGLNIMIGGCIKWV